MKTSTAGNSYKERRKAGLCGTSGCTNKPYGEAFCKSCKKRRAGYKHLHNSRKPAPPSSKIKVFTGPDGARRSILKLFRQIEGAEIGTRGWPDLWYIKDGRAHFVEIKQTGDHMSIDQERCHAALAMAGIVVQVWDPEAVLMLADQFKQRGAALAEKAQSQKRKIAVIDAADDNSKDGTNA
jgi:hypothetical protein